MATTGVRCIVEVAAAGPHPHPRPPPTAATPGRRPMGRWERRGEAEADNSRDSDALASVCKINMGAALCEDDGGLSREDLIGAGEH